MININTFGIPQKRNGSGSTTIYITNSNVSTGKSFEPHYLWGQYFDDTSDISGDLSNVNNIYAVGGIRANSITAYTGTLTSLNSTNIASSIIGATTKITSPLIEADTAQLDTLTVSTSADITSLESDAITTDNITAGNSYITYADIETADITTADIDTLTSTDITTANLNVTTFADIVKAYIKELSSDEITTEYLTVTKAAHFFELIIDKIKAAGGAYLFTPADGFTIIKVETLSNGDKRLYFLANDGDKAIWNMWQTGDQALCQDFNNAEVGKTYDVSTKYWWTLVTKTNNDVSGEENGVTVNLGTTDEPNNVVCHYIDVSTTEKDGNCTVNPEVGDDVVMLGSRVANDEQRQNAMYIAAYASIDPEIKAPLICQYRGINDFNLKNHKYSWLAAGVTAAGESAGRVANYITGNFVTTAGDNISTLVTTLNGNVQTMQSQVSTLTNTVNGMTSTVESHTSSISYLNNIYGDVYSTVESQNSQISTLTNTVNGMTSTIESHTSSISTLNNDVSGMQSTVTTNSNNISSLTNTVNGMSSTVESHTSSISTLNNDVSGMQSTVTTNSNNISTLTNTVNGMTSTVESHTSSISTLNNDVSGMQSTVTTNSNNISSLTNTVNGLNSTVESHTSSITVINEDMSDLRTDTQSYFSQISTLSNTVDGLTSTVEGHTTSISTLTNDVSGIQSTVTQHSSNLSSLNVSVNGLNSTTASHTSQINSLTSDLETAESNITSLQTTATGIQTQVTSIKGNAVNRNLMSHGNFYWNADDTTADYDEVYERYYRANGDTDYNDIYTSTVYISVADKYTWSFYLPEGTSCVIDQNVAVCQYTNSSGYGRNYNSFLAPSAVGYDENDTFTLNNVVYYRYYVTSDTLNTGYYYGVNLYGFSGYADILFPKLELGDTPSSYVIKSSTIKQTADSIEAKVEETGVNITDGTIDITAGKVNFINPTGTNNKIWIDTSDGTLHAVNGDYSGTVKANVMFSPTTSLSGNQTINIDLSTHTSNILCSAGVGATLTMVLPSPSTYDGLEMTFFFPVTTRSTGGCVINYSGGIMYNDSSTSLLTGATSLGIIGNQLVRIRAIVDKWYVISGEVTTV